MSARSLEQDEHALRCAVADTARAMSEQGLSPRRAGNVSARFGSDMLMTPSGVRYEELDAAKIVRVAEDGATLPGELKPSSEWRMHAAVYRVKPEAKAIVHCHSTDATALACAHRPIPAFHYMVCLAGGSDIPLAPYATFGTQALADAVAATLKDRRAALMAHHGQIATGPDLQSALDLAGEVETLAGMYIRTLQAGSGPVLDDEEIARVIDAFRGYGQG